MKKNFKLGVIGCGFMSSAIIKGAINGKILSAEQIYVSDINQDSLDKIATLGVKTTQDNIDLVNNSVVLLQIKQSQNY